MTNHPRTRLIPCGLAAAALLALPAASDAAPNGLWKGNLYAYGHYSGDSNKTGSVKFRVKRHKRVVKFKYVDPYYLCINDAFDPTDDTPERAQWTFKTFRIKHGKVHKVVKTSGARVELKGTFKGKVAKGSIDYTSYGAGCSKGWYWKAKLSG